MEGCLAAPLDTVTKVGLKFTVALTVVPVDSLTVALIVVLSPPEASRSVLVPTLSAEGTLEKYSEIFLGRFRGGKPDSAISVIWRIGNSEQPYKVVNNFCTCVCIVV